MPVKSMKQNNYFFAHPDKLGGIEKVMEYAHKTDYSKIPERVKPSRRSVTEHMGPPQRRKRAK